MDKSIWNASHHVLLNYGDCGLWFVQRLISESMLHQLGELIDLVKEKLAAEEAELKEIWFRMALCISHLAIVLRSLAKPDRQKWVSLLVEVLRAMLPAPVAVHKTVLKALLLLWQADEDPSRTYAEESQQLEALRKSPRLQDVRSEFRELVSAC